MKSVITQWANDWGRHMGIYGIRTERVEPGNHDDLDAFRHAFCHAVLVSHINLAKPDLVFAWMIHGDASHTSSEFIGALMESPLFGSSAKPCPKHMDLHNNRVGKNLGFSKREMLFYLEKGEDSLRALAAKVAEAVRNEITINRLDDPRMPIECFHSARIPGGNYKWRTQADDKVRFDHVLREGKVFNLENPPQGEHPGSEYNCRCWAEAVIEKNK
jgi:SPP1 gp7 family putative phage head morphogenesis protein